MKYSRIGGKNMYIFIIVAIFLGEFYVKNSIEKKYVNGKQKKIMRNRIRIRKSYNYGFAFNKGEKCPLLVATLSLGLAVFCTLVFIFSLGKNGNTLLRLGLSFLLGGAYSNTYDRIRRKYVVDYFSFEVKSVKLRNLVFNLSDIFILIGVLMVILSEGK